VFDVAVPDHVVPGIAASRAALVGLKYAHVRSPVSVDNWLESCEMVIDWAETYVLSGMYVPVSAGDVAAAMSGVAGVKISNATGGVDVRYSGLGPVAVMDKDNLFGRRTANDPTVIVIPDVSCTSWTPDGRLATPFHANAPVFRPV